MSDVRMSEEPGSGAPASGQGSVGSWIAGVFIDPRATFESIARRSAEPHPSDPAKTVDRTRWWIPLIIVAVVAGLMAVLVIVPYVALPAQAEAVRSAVIDHGGTAEQAQEMIERGRPFIMPFATFWAIAGTVLMLFVFAGISHGIMRGLGGKGTFRVARDVVAYGLLVSSLGTLVKLPLMVLRKTMFVETGAAIFFPHLEPSDALYRFLFAGFDIFTLWWVFVLGVGLSAGYKTGRGKAFAAAIIVWAITTAMATFSRGGGSFGA
jgi:hypothetical protein